MIATASVFDNRWEDAEEANPSSDLPFAICRLARRAYFSTIRHFYHHHSSAIKEEKSSTKVWASSALVIK